MHDGPTLNARCSRKTGVVRDPNGLDALNEAGELVKMPIVHADGRAQGQAHAMQADVVVLTGLAQHGQRRAASGKEVLAVDFHKTQGRALLKHLGILGVPQADTGPGRKRRHQPFFSSLALASASVKPFKSLHVPLATYFHSSTALSPLASPAHEWLPDKLAQSF